MARASEKASREARRGELDVSTLSAKEGAGQAAGVERSASASMAKERGRKRLTRGGHL